MDVIAVKLNIELNLALVFLVPMWRISHVGIGGWREWEERRGRL